VIVLKIKDADGITVKENDWVELFGSQSGGGCLSFFGQVKCKDGILHPFETVCYRYFTKIDSLPADAVPLKDSPGLWRNPKKSDGMTEEEFDGWHMNLASSPISDEKHFLLESA